MAAYLPDRWQTELKRIYYARQIKKNTFITDEPEFDILHNLLEPDDWVIDIGANIGHYTKRFSEIVGAKGRVIAFEPIPTTFSLLSANVNQFSHPNVTLVNTAVSNKLDVVGMSLPKFSSGLTNFYMAHISSDTDSELSVLTLSLDSLCIQQKIALVKIDAEGHEPLVLAGMQKLIRQHRPHLIIETGSSKIIDDLKALGYTAEILKNSPNILFKPKTVDK